MLNLNRVEIIGNLGRDPEIINTQSGGKMAVLSVATTERFKRADEKVERTEWHRIKVLSPRLVEIVEQIATKGAFVRLEGKLQTSSWTDESGTKRYATDVIVGVGGSFSLLSARAEKPATTNTNAPADEAPAQRFSDDDIPF